MRMRLLKQSMKRKEQDLSNNIVFFVYFTLLLSKSNKVFAVIRRVRSSVMVIIHVVLSNLINEFFNQPDPITLFN